MPLLNHVNASPSTGIYITYTARMEQPKNRGGRPAKQADERMVQRSLRMPPDLWAAIDAHGLDWLRETVRRSHALTVKGNTNGGRIHLP